MYGGKVVDIAARILFVSPQRARFAVLQSGLEGQGCETLWAADVDQAVMALEAADFDAVFAEVDDVDLVAQLGRIRAVMPERYLPIIGVGENAEPSLDLRLADVPHPTQALMRIDHLMRAAIAEEEFVLRCQTFEEHDAKLHKVGHDRQPLAVLAIGQSDERFIALSNCLRERGVDLVAAPTPYTAFDYLHERAFDAALLWGGESRSVAMSIASGMKRNTRLYHIPLVFYLRDGDEVNLTDLYRRGFADVVETEVSEDETSARLVSLAENYRRRVAIRRALDSVRVSHLTDSVTGLFHREPFASHLGRVYASTKKRKRTMSLCVLRVRKTEALSAINRGGWLDKALPQVGAMISRLVRVEDTAASVAPDSFAVMMPATTAPAARLAAERIAAVIACTAFDAGPERSPFVIDFDIGVAEMQPDEGPIELFERAVANARQAAAA